MQATARMTSVVSPMPPTSRRLIRIGPKGIELKREGPKGKFWFLLPTTRLNHTLFVKSRTFSLPPDTEIHDSFDRPIPLSRGKVIQAIL
jgi:hypothetical protein